MISFVSQIGLRWLKILRSPPFWPKKNVKQKLENTSIASLTSCLLLQGARHLHHLNFVIEVQQI